MASANKKKKTYTEMDDILNFVLESESGSDISIDDTSDDSDENVEYISEEVVESSDQNEEHKNENETLISQMAAVMKKI